jgi:small subunit ribosomal protein S8
MIIDPISDMLTRIRNTVLNRQESVEMPSSKIKEAILAILKKEGYIADFKIKSKKGFSVIKVDLEYKNGEVPIQHIERVSKPGLRIYSPSVRIPRVLSGFGLVILSTPQGVMSGRDAKRGLVEK